MDIQTEANKKLVSISVDISKMTLKTFIKITLFMSKNSKKIPNLKTKQSLKTLVKNNSSIKKVDIENIELDDKDLLIFKNIAKKNGLKYSLVYNEYEKKYTFFFNSGKAEVYEHVYNELRQVLEKRKDVILDVEKKSLAEKIKEKKYIIEKSKILKQQKQKNIKKGKVL